MLPLYPFLVPLLLALAPAAASAEPVQIKPSLTRLNANLELPAGKTAADYAAKEGYRDLVELLSGKTN